ncbi:hypothetical protein LCGC14_2029000, partial [marine sediment metagenome]
HTATADIDGLETITVDLADNLATITFDDSKTSAEAIASAIDDAGFEATVAAISTMHKNVMIRIRDVHVTTGKYLSTGDSAVRAEGAVRWPERWKDPRGVIYGHAPRYAVKRDFTPAGTSCLGIDTGCVFGGYLTAVIIDPSWLEVGRFEYVQVRAAKKYTEPYIEGEDYVKYAQPQDL